VSDDAPKVLCYELSRDRDQDSSYVQLNLHVFMSKVEQVAELYEQTIDNRAGYRDQETARRIGGWWKSLLDAGHLERFDSQSNLASFRVRWQEFEPRADLDPRSRGYCSGHIESLGNGTFLSAKLGWALLEKVAKRSAKISEGRGDPIDDAIFVVRALEGLGAVLVERMDRRDFSVPFTIVRKKGRRMRLRSEGVLAMVGG